MLDPEWARRSDYDVYHLQFGYDRCTAARLEELVRVVRGRGKPFMFTVHQLRDPDSLDPSPHDERLDVLVPSSDAVITLTSGAADEIRRRWGREAWVIPHPHVVDLQTMTRALEVRPMWRHRPFRVGLDLTELTANVDAMRVLPTLVDTVAGLEAAVLQVDQRRGCDDTPQGRQLSAWLDDAARAGLLELYVHDPYPDPRLWAHLASLDLAVLPYTFGTHSARLEVCRDLQTTVLAPSCGYYAEQGPVLTFTSDENGFDAGSLHDAVVRAHAERPRWGASIEERTAQRREVSALHHELYRLLSR